MPRLIDANVLKQLIPDTSVDMFENCRNCKLLSREEVIAIIDKAPTVDAEIVVHCKECVFYKAGHIDDYGYRTSGWCNLVYTPTCDNGYCIDGELKGGENDV